jgi:hypothetical protein
MPTYSDNMARNYGMSVRASGILDRFMETQKETLTTDQILGRCSHGTDFYWGHRERQPRKIAQYFRANPKYAVLGATRPRKYILHANLK